MRSLLAIISTLLVVGACAPEDSERRPAPEPPEGTAVFRERMFDAFRHERGSAEGFPLRAIMGGGGALADLDRDGDLDIVCIQGDPNAGPSCLLLQESGPRFRRVDLPPMRGYGMGCAVADADGDGDVDLFISAVGSDRFLRNEGAGRFVDVTEEVGLGDEGYASSATWFDADGDGDLDLYVARYVGPTSPAPFCRSVETGGRDYCNPTSYPRTRDLLYRNEGDHFVEVGEKVGLGARTGYGLAVIASDLDVDGDIDVYVANDQSPAFLWRNDGQGRFREEAMEVGCALDGEGAAIAGMGIVAEDFDGDADFDLFVTNIRERDHLFLRRDEETWTDVSARWGRPDWLRPRTGFGVAAFDQDHDGRLDLFLANGSVMARAVGEVADADEAYAEPDDFLRFRDGRFAADREALPAGRRSDIARGVARGDIDGDGDIDLLVFRNGASPLLLENLARAPGRSLTVDPRDAAGAPALNARVTLVSTGGRRIAETRSQESYLSSRDPRAHFGLAEGEKVTEVQVRWADGTLVRLPAPEPDMTVLVVTPPSKETR